MAPISSLRLKNEWEECGREGEELLAESWECILNKGVGNQPNEVWESFYTPSLRYYHWVLETRTSPHEGWTGLVRLESFQIQFDLETCDPDQSQ
jgi:hypothetical protein